LINPAIFIAGLIVAQVCAAIGDSRCKSLSVKRFRAISPMDKGAQLTGQDDLFDCRINNKVL